MEQPLNGVSLPKYCFRYKFISMSNHCRVLTGSFFWRSSIAAKSSSSVFTLKTKHQMFYVHTTRWKFKDATVMGHFGSAFENKPGAKSTLSRGHGFKKRIRFQNVFLKSSVLVTD